jgi:phosphoserine aminotransferase
MDQPPDSGLVTEVQKILGGAGTTILAAVAGRALGHARDVRMKRRPFLCWEMLWEIPTAFGMAVVGEGVGNYLNLPSTGIVALIAVCSYLGPRGVGSIVDRWIDRK